MIVCREVRVLVTPPVGQPPKRSAVVTSQRTTAGHPPGYLVGSAANTNNQPRQRSVTVTRLSLRFPDRRSTQWFSNRGPSVHHRSVLASTGQRMAPSVSSKLSTFEPLCDLFSRCSERDLRKDLGFENRDSLNIGEEWAVQDLNL